MTNSHDNSDSNGLTRRQFLTYVLGGTGAFMVTMLGAPLVVSAFDPVHRGSEGGFSETNWKVSDFSDKLPTQVKYMQEIGDGWNSKKIENDVFVIVRDKKLMIMSHVCTHLGCHVNGSVANGKSSAAMYGNGQEWFECPCHGSQFNVYGVQTPASPAPRPLDLYYYRVNTDGTIEVGSSFQRTDKTWSYNPNPSIQS
jgi:menaquinol-cytochrome c reductase iron-sulfur subunit